MVSAVQVGGRAAVKFWTRGHHLGTGLLPNRNLFFVDLDTILMNKIRLDIFYV